MQSCRIQSKMRQCSDRLVTWSKAVKQKTGIANELYPRCSDFTWQVQTDTSSSAAQARVTGFGRGVEICLDDISSLCSHSDNAM
jgi:hypothetical protein